MTGRIIFRLLFIAVLVAAAASCKTWASITMTCQFDFHAGKGGCSFINSTSLVGRGCVKAEVYHVTRKEVIDMATLCASEVPPMQSVTRSLLFNASTVEACRPAVVKQGGKPEKIEKCMLRLSEVKP
jgi:hypothetical protein